MEWRIETKVGKFWDETKYLENNIDVELAQKILSLRQKCLDKVTKKEWTLEEYKQFSKVIRKMMIDRFLTFYNLANLYLDLSIEECHTEINYLNQSGLINPSVSSNSFHELMAKSIYDFNGKILSLTNIILTEEEKRDRLLDNEHKIMAYKDILAQLKDPNSYYTNTLKEIFREIVETAVQNPKLKSNILNMESQIISCRIKNIRSIIEHLNCQLETKKTTITNYKYIGR